MRECCRIVLILISGAVVGGALAGLFLWLYIALLCYGIRHLPL